MGCKGKEKSRKPADAKTGGQAGVLAGNDKFSFKYSKLTLLVRHIFL